MARKEELLKKLAEDREAVRGLIRNGVSLETIESMLDHDTEHTAYERYLIWEAAYEELQRKEEM